MDNKAINQRIVETYREKAFSKRESREESSRPRSAGSKGNVALTGIDPDEVIKRSDYKTEGAYLMALADYEAKMQSPEFRHAMEKVITRQRQEAAAQAQEEQRKHYAEIRKGLKLDSFERANVDRQAREQAQADFAAGKISAKEIGSAAENYAAGLEKAALDQKANNIQTNDFIRASWRGSTQEQDEGE